MRKLWLICGLLLALGGAVFAQEEETPVAPAPPVPAREAAPVVPPPQLPPVQDFPAQEYRFYDDYPWSLNGSFELGRSGRKGVATGYGVSLDRYLGTEYVALGIRGVMHSDGNTISATEALFNFRVYAPIRNSNTALFTQWGFGYSFYTEEGRERNTYTLDWLAGARFYINERILRGFYIEPYFRLGFPFLVGGGIAVGHWFNF